MADTYTILGTRPDVEFLGGTLTRNVMVVSVLTREHSVYFETRIPSKDYTAQVAKENAFGFTIVYELLFDIPGVAAVTWSQQTTDTGQLQDHVLIYVESTSGNSSGIVNVPYSQFAQELVKPKVAKLRTALDDAENA